MKLSLTTSLTVVAAFALSYIAPAPTACQGLPSPAAQKDSKGAAAVQPVPRLADGHPDLNGFWASSSGPDTPVNATFGPPDRGARRGDNEAKARLDRSESTSLQTGVDREGQGPCEARE